MNEWATADRISDAIVDLINAEIRRQVAADTVEPLQVLAGMLLAVLGVLRTMGPTRPRPLVEMERAIRVCLHSLPGGQRPNVR